MPRRWNKVGSVQTPNIREAWIGQEQTLLWPVLKARKLKKKSQLNPQQAEKMYSELGFRNRSCIARESRISSTKCPSIGEINTTWWDHDVYPPSLKQKERSCQYLPMAFLYREWLPEPINSSPVLLSNTTITHSVPRGPAQTNNITHVGKPTIGKSAPPTSQDLLPCLNINPTDLGKMPWE